MHKTNQITTNKQTRESRSCNIQMGVIRLLPFLFVFLFLVLLLWIRLQALHWVRVDRVGALTPDLGGNAFSFSPVNITLAVNLWYEASIMRKTILYIPSFFRAFIFLSEILNFIEGTFWIYWDDHVISVPNSMCYVSFTDLWILNVWFKCIFEFCLQVFYWGFVCSFVLQLCLLRTWLDVPCFASG